MQVIQKLEKVHIPGPIPSPDEDLDPNGGIALGHPRGPFDLIRIFPEVVKKEDYDANPLGPLAAFTLSSGDSNPSFDGMSIRQDLDIDIMDESYQGLAAIFEAWNNELSEGETSVLLSQPPGVLTSLYDEDTGLYRIAFTITLDSE